MARDSEATRKFIREAQDRFELATTAYSYSRDKSLDDWKFRLGEQWPPDIQTARVRDGRPCLVMNRIVAILAQILNDQRQQRPGIKVNPVGDGADRTTADIEQGIIRHIEVRSDAEIARDNAFDAMATGGEGYYRILTEWEGDDWEQELRISPIWNPFSVFFDPSSVCPDRSDAMWCFIICDLTKEAYQAKYGKSKLAMRDDWSAIGNATPGWMPAGSARIAEYFYVEEEIIRRGNDERTKRNVKWAKINAIEILDERDLQDEFIPIIPVIGQETVIDGKREISGAVRPIKDPQRQYNFMQSAATEAIALAPKPPWMMAEGQDEGHPEWKNANSGNYHTLYYKATSLNGTPLPPPQRMVAEPPIQAMSHMIAQASDDLKSISGIYDPALGKSKSDQSGKQVELLQSQSKAGNINWTDNLSRSMRYEGRQLLAKIPKVYTEPKVQRIIAPDDTHSHVVIHNGDDQKQQAIELAMKNQINKIYDISTGKYDITTSVQPSYQSRRQEAVADIMQLVQAFPPLMQVAGDLLVRNTDIPGAEQIADRLQRMLPPQALATDDPAGQAANAQAQLQATAAQLQQATQLLQQQHEIIQTKQVENQAKIDVERLKQETAIAVAEINTKAQEPLTRMKYEFDMWKELHGGAHDVGMQAEDHAHEQDMAQQQQQAAAQQQQSQQSADQSSQFSQQAHEAQQAEQQQQNQPEPVSK